MIYLVIVPNGSLVIMNMFSIEAKRMAARPGFEVYQMENPK
jgi:hypothetical protein